MGRKTFLAIILVTVLSFVFLINSAWSYCTCVCINGENQAVCSNSTFDIPPICPPKLCSIAPSEVQPLQPDTIDPSGEQDCRIEEVYDLYTERYVWQEVCE